MKCCGYCGAEFRPKRRKQQFCSAKCGSFGRWDNRGREYPQTLSCEWCNGEFVVTEKGHRRLYCSLSCASQATYPFTRGRQPIHNSNGRSYIVCRDGSAYAYYRAVVEAHLGRDLTTDEFVHHINGDPGDDRIENLQVMSNSEHMTLHNTLRFGEKAAA